MTYDPRHVGESGGEPRHLVDPDRLIDDATAAMRALRSDPVRPNSWRSCRSRSAGDRARAGRRRPGHRRPRPRRRVCRTKRAISRGTRSALRRGRGRPRRRTHRRIARDDPGVRSVGRSCCTHRPRRTRRTRSPRPVRRQSQRDADSQPGRAGRVRPGGTGDRHRLPQCSWSAMTTRSSTRTQYPDWQRQRRGSTTFSFRGSHFDVFQPEQAPGFGRTVFEHFRSALISRGDRR